MQLKSNDNLTLTSSFSNSFKTNFNSKLKIITGYTAQDNFIIRIDKKNIEMGQSLMH